MSQSQLDELYERVYGPDSRLCLVTKKKTYLNVIHFVLCGSTQNVSRDKDGSESVKLYSYPFNSLPPLECHVSPPLAVINGGPKLAGLDLHTISSNYHGQGSSEIQATKERLTLLDKIWGLIMGSRDSAKQWSQIGRDDGLGHETD
jgi:hypothetical protein